MCIVSKTKKAWECYQWYLQCEAPHPHVEYKNGTLHMQLVKAVPVCVSSNPNDVTQVFAQVNRWKQKAVWSHTWHEYVTSIAHRTTQQYVDIMRAVDVPMGTFCHGDLTLENVLVDHKDMYYIDPNPGKFSSAWLDIGKLAFSLEYHTRFNSYWLTTPVKQRIEECLEDWNPTLVKAVLISHIVRLEGYQPRELIEEWLSCVCS